MKSLASLGVVVLASAALAHGPGENRPEAPPEFGVQGGPGMPPEGRGPEMPPPPGGEGPGMGSGPRSGMGMGMGMGGRGPLVEVTEAQEKELVDFIKTNDPLLAEHLGKAKAQGDKSYRGHLSGMWRMYKDASERERWVKQARARREIRELSAQYRRAADAEKPAIKEKLVKPVGDLFDADLAEKSRAADNMAAEAARLKDRIAKRREAKDALVKQRVEKIVGESEDWSW